MAADGTVSILGAVKAALSLYGKNIRVVAIAGVLGAVFSTLFTMFSVSLPALGLIWALLSLAVMGFIYAALIGAALSGPEGLSQRATQEGLRVLGATAIIGFFMGIVFLVVVMADGVVLAVAAVDYVPQLQAAGQDQARILEVMTHFAQQKPWVIVIIGLVNAAVWLTLTSRLYIAAPATYDQKRILTFETWKWTKGAMLRIIAARLIVLGPAYLLTLALALGLDYAFGLNPFDPNALQTAARNSPAIFAALSLVEEFVQFGFYFALEAGLSAYFYKKLGPQSRAASAF